MSGTKLRKKRKYIPHAPLPDCGSSFLGNFLMRGKNTIGSVVEIKLESRV